MERGVIDNMEQELPAGNGPVDGVEFQGKFGSGGSNIGCRPSTLRASVAQIAQVWLRRVGGKRLGLVNSESGPAALA